MILVVLNIGYTLKSPGELLKILKIRLYVIPVKYEFLGSWAEALAFFF